MNRTKGVLATILSSVIFGFTPILARMTYDGGSNSINMVFFRSFLGLPFLFLLLRGRGISLRLKRQEVKDLALGGFLGSTLTTLSLYASYNFISVGTATTLHFAYPLLVVLVGFIFYKEKPSRQKIVALSLGLLGVLAFMEAGGAGATLGVALALFSAVTFTFKIIWMEKSTIAAMDSMKAVFYFCVCDCLLAGAAGLATGQLTFQLTGRAWLFSVVVALLVSVVAVPLFKYAVCNVGSTTASILSTLEPITSVFFGMIFMQEQLTLFKGVGCVCIIVSVLLVSLERQGRKSAAAGKR